VAGREWSRGRFRARNSGTDHVFDLKMRAKMLAMTAALGLGVLATAMSTDLFAVEKPTSIVLGKTAEYPSSGCPNSSNCEVIARVTGIQMMAAGVNHPFRAPANGHVVAWWLKLPTLHRSQLRSFSELFGGSPAARIGILRRGKRGRVRLVRESPVEQLREHLGAKGRVRFKLAEPLRVKEGDYVGLTAVTWVPAFAVGLRSDTDVWLASRPKSRCDTPSSRDPDRFAAYYRRSDAHDQVSTVRHYRCVYRTARLLYWARLAPDPTPGTPSP
jgi:hypothetical protein